jgi:hypothetical protein
VEVLSKSNPTQSLSDRQNAKHSVYDNPFLNNKSYSNWTQRLLLVVFNSGVQPVTAVNTKSTQSINSSRLIHIKSSILIEYTDMRSFSMFIHTQIHVSLVVINVAVVDVRGVVVVLATEVELDVLVLVTTAVNDTFPIFSSVIIS